MNLLDVACAGGVLHLNGRPLAMQGAKDGPLTLGLRPEDLEPVAPGTAGALDLAVTHVEELGPQRLVHGTVAGQPVIAALPADAPRADRLSLAFRADRAHLFDAATGLRLG
jgi:sn-glycerol 3-phosphate transport system ATP-binding protein